MRFIVLDSSVQVIEQFFFSHESFNMQRHLFFTSVILFSSMFSKSRFPHVIFSSQTRFFSHPVSLITCDLGVMLEITGGVSATALAYIFPAACYFKLTDRSLPWHHRVKLPAVGCVSFGVVVMVISLYLALGKSWSAEGSAKICGI